MSVTLPHNETRRRRNTKTEGIRQRILEESVKLFLEQGYEKTTTRQILQRVGILNGSLYNIYKGKEDIFSDIIILTLGEILAQSPDEPDDDRGWVDRLCYILCVEIHLSSRSPRMAELLSLMVSNKAIRDKVYRSALSWPHSPEIKGTISLTRLEMLTGATGTLIQGMAGSTEGIDEDDAMRCVLDFSNSVFREYPVDVEEVLPRFKSNMSSHRVVVCGVPIL